MRGLTQARLAELAEIETMTVSRIETGQNFSKKENIEMFAKVLNVDIREFFDFGHYKRKRDLIDDINCMLEKASLSDLMFCKKLFARILKILNKNLYIPSKKRTTEKVILF